MDTSSVEILTAVNSFYQQAWDKLLYFITALVAVIGVIVPLVIQRLQNRNLKIQENQIKLSVKDDIIGEIVPKIQEKYDSQISSFKNEIDQKLLKLNAMTWFIQGSSALDQKSYDQAVGDYFYSLKLAFSAGDKMNSNRAITNLYICFDNLTKSQVDEALELSEINLDDLVKEIYEEDDGGAVYDNIRKLKVKYKSLSITANKTKNG